jgi:amino acid adenylation domain-containing protein/non-ribosomal peptide synthase protein (TIGR01720 family)
MSMGGLSAEQRQLLMYLLEEEDIQSQQRSLPSLRADLEGRYQPFPLTDIQQAYLIGRNDTFEIGNVSCQGYTEFESDNLDLERYNLALQRLIERHDMLRAIVHPHGQQQILASVPAYQIPVVDLRGQSSEKVAAQLEAIRQRMSHQVLPTDRCPLFEICASRLDDRRTRIHFSIDALIADQWSLQILFQELDALYQNPDAALSPIEISFRDYVLTELSLQTEEFYQRAKEYWLNRIPTLPPAPDLPLAQNPALLTKPKFQRMSATLSPPQWMQLKNRAKKAGITPSGILLTAFVDILKFWGKTSKFTLNLTLFNRLPLHPQVNQLVGDFTSMTLLEVKESAPATFAERARSLQEQLWADLEYRHFSGVRVLRELSRSQGGKTKAIAPIVFTSTLTLDNLSQDNTAIANQTGETVYGITQTPQVWLDHQVFEQAGTLVFNWDVVAELFPPGLLDDMFSAYCHLLQRLADEEEAWHQTTSLVPVDLAQRQAINSTTAPIPAGLLHTLFARQVEARSHQLAVVTPNRTFTYAELFHLTNQLGRRLRQLGARPNQLVAVVMEKGWEQVVAVLGILTAGAAYLPIDPSLPQERQWYLLEQGEVRIILTQSQWDSALEFPEGTIRLCVDTQELAGESDRPLEPLQQQTDLAYVIYTSGSTGTPKGVAIDHRGAINTIVDINQRFNVRSQDRVLALSSLSFDLSVYDIFGILAAGGTIVIPEASATKDPSRWAEIILQEQVTVWNSVPALMQMLVDYAAVRAEVNLTSVRLVLLSGDWIPLGLPDRIKAASEKAQVISLGGATEASIWSILYPIQQVNPAWKSIPYGCPMTNQQFHILDRNLEPVPVWVPGQLYIGGVGLAKGYWRDREKTANNFIIHPITKERLYRTGDLGYYLPDGNICFIGREDFQVKIQGYRIELGEIETALELHPAVAHAVVAAVSEQQSHKRLVAYVVPGEQPAPTDEELRQFLSQKLPAYMMPSSFVLLNTLPLTPNGKVDRQSLPIPGEIVELEKGFVPPRTSIEKTLAQIWSKLLHLEQVGIYDNFFNLGGDSIVGIQAIAQADRAGIQLTPRQLFASPTIAELAAVADLTPAIPASQQPVTGLVPLAPIQLWLLEQNLPNPHHWNLSLLLQQQKLDASLLETACQHLLCHHDALRLRCVEKSGWQQYNQALGETVAFERIDLSQLPENERSPAIEAAAAKLQTTLNMSSGPLIRFALFDLGSQHGDRLAIAAHHLGIDGVSLRILIEDLQTAYQQLSQGEAIQLPPKTTSYQQWTRKLTEYAQSAQMQQELDYWLKALPHQSDRLPVDYSLGKNTESSTRVVSGFLDVKDSQALLRELPITYAVQIQEVLLSALLHVISQWTGKNSILLDLMAHGREDILADVDLSRTVGWFTTIYPVFFQLGNAHSPEQALQPVKQQLRQVPNRGIGYGLLRYLALEPNISEQLRTLPEAEIAFNYIGQTNQHFSDTSLFQLAPESTGSNFDPQGIRKHLLAVVAKIGSGKLQFEWIYSENFYQRATIENLSEKFVDTLRSLVLTRKEFTHES